MQEWHEDGPQRRAGCLTPRVHACGLLLPNPPAIVQSTAPTPVTNLGDQEVTWGPGVSGGRVARQPWKSESQGVDR